MANWKRGLVIGKFYPPHRGHKFLIETARAGVEALTVLVCDKPGEQPPASLRAAWLREIHPDITVRVIPDIGRDDDSQAWAAYTIHLLGYAPDVVFTSEDYGYAYARFIGCQHVQVDKARQVVPCSGTQVRADPLAWWDFLEPCVRAYYVIRVCIVGAESSGTTTMAQALAAHYQTMWVEEYGREYSIKKMQTGQPQWESAEFVHIAAEQSQREDWAARTANRLLICDTDAFATSIWHQRYLGRREASVEAIAASRHYDLYLLTDVDIPFVQDGFRDGEHIRYLMHGVFLVELQAQNKPFALLSGSHPARLEKAISLIEPLIGVVPH